METTARAGVQIVPIAGNNDRLIPEYVVYHGPDYLDVDGTVVRGPVRLSMDEATWAVRFHAEATS